MGHAACRRTGTTESRVRPPRSVHVRFVVDVVVFGQDFLRIRRFCPFSYHSLNDPYIFIYTFLFQEGQTDEAWDPAKKRCSFRRRLALNIKVLALLRKK